MPRTELFESDWPHARVLVGCAVVKFNPAVKQEEHTISKDDDTVLIFEITWDHFTEMNKAKAIHDINEVIESGQAEYTPTNKDGIVVEHSYNHVMAYFNMDGTYYVQHGHVTNVWSRPRGPREPLIVKRGKALVRMYAN